MNTLFSKLSQIHSLSKGLQDYLAKNIKPFLAEKEQIIHEPGRISNKVFYIEEGLVRSYYLFEGKEVTNWFLDSGHILVPIQSYYDRSISEEYIQCLENCKLAAIDYAVLQQAYLLFPEFNFISRVLTEQYYVMAEKRAFQLRMHTAEQKLKLLLEEHPDILKKLKQKYIASYLGISSETLSRLLSNTF